MTSEYMLDNRNRWRRRPGPIIPFNAGPGQTLMGFIVALLVISLLASAFGCAVNKQTSDADGVAVYGGAAAMNTVSTQGPDYRATSNIPMGIVDSKDFSMAGANPMTVMSIDLGGGQILNLGSGGNGNIDVGIENLQTGYKSTVKGDWGGRDEIVAHAQVALMLYETMKHLSLDEKEAQIAKIEQAGKVASAVIPLLRAMAGVP